MGFTLDCPFCFGSHSDIMNVFLKAVLIFRKEKWGGTAFPQTTPLI